MPKAKFSKEFKDWKSLSKKIQTLKDFAELSTDELIGSYDEKQGKRFKIEGFLEEFALVKNEAEDLIMNARNIVFK